MAREFMTGNDDLIVSIERRLSGGCGLRQRGLPQVHSMRGIDLSAFQITRFAGLALDGPVL